MDALELIKRLGGWEGYRVATADRVAVTGPEGVQEQCWIELKPIWDRPRRCVECGHMTTAIHDVTERWVRDLSLFELETHLLVHRVRVACPHCGPRVEALDWLDRYSRVTRRLAESVARLCAFAPIKKAAEFFNLHWQTVKDIDKQHLLHTLGPPDLSGVTLLAMDEFAIRKGHRYATVVVDPTTKRILWVGRGRTREDVRPFFELLGEAGCRNIRAVAMDMNGAYEEEVKLHCPQAKVVYDLFHVVAKYGREVIDRVRVDEANRLRDDKPARKVIKSARWLLLRNDSNIKCEADRVRLAELLSANRKLATVYVLKDDLKSLWDYRHKGYARQFWKDWYSRAIRSRIEPLKSFAKRMKDRLPGILSHCRWPLHTSLLEGINNKIKVIKRMAYGFRDDEYFFLKLRAAFPGIP